MSVASVCFNSFNNYYLSELNKMINDARTKNNRNLMLIYRKVAFSVSKYPFPILTSNQAMSLEGVGGTICKLFENLINCYKEKIRKDSIDYIELAKTINLDFKSKKNFKSKKTKRKELEPVIENPYLLSNTVHKIKAKKNLVDIPLYSSIWTCVISGYILYIQNEKYELNINDVLAMGQTIKEQLKTININVDSCSKSDFDKMKELNVIDNIDAKIVKINDYLIKLASLELKKIGIEIIKDNKGEINFDMYEKPFDDEELLNKKYDEFCKEKETQKENQDLLDNFLSFMSGEEKKEDSDNISLVIDQRERGANDEDFKEEILNTISSSNTIKLTERNLALGDFLWIYTDKETSIEYVIDCIIERKTLNDLASSILDGRYTEQKFRLKNSPFTNIYYLFEGTSLNGVQSKGSITKSALNTAIYHTLNIHDINIIKTNSTMDTIKFIIDLDGLIRNNFSFLMDENGEKVTYDKYLAHNAKTKNSSIEKIFLKQLRTFDNCGSKSVEIISKCFKTPVKFYSIINKCKENKATDESMANIINIASYLDENGEETNSKNILKYMKKENYSKIKKGVKSVKKLRKDTVNQIINFYTIKDDSSLETSDKEEDEKTEEDIK